MSDEEILGIVNEVWKTQWNHDRITATVELNTSTRIRVRVERMYSAPGLTFAHLEALAAGAAGISGNDRVTDGENPAAPVGVGLVGRPIGSYGSAVPGFTARRIELGYSLETVAARLTLGTHDLRGVQTTLQAVSGWERGEYRPSEDRIDLLAEILGVSRSTVEDWFGIGIVAEVHHAA